MISHFHLPSCLLLFCSLFLLEVSTGIFKLPSSTVTVLQTSQVTFVFFHCQVQFTAVLLNYSGCDCLLPIQVQSTAVLLNYSGCDCLLPIQVQLQLYFRTTQAQLCTTSSRATVYYSEFILLEFIYEVSNKHLIPTIYLLNSTIIKSRTSFLSQNILLLSLKLHRLSQIHQLFKLKTSFYIHCLSQIHHLLKSKTSSYVYLTLLLKHKTSSR